MSPFLAHSDFAFKEILKLNNMFKGLGEDGINYLLQKHTKTVARIKIVAAMKERSTTRQFSYSQCIPLPRRCTTCLPPQAMEMTSSMASSTLCAKTGLG
eukprot:11590660-Ditylum_brightwellii.AAC.1